MGAAQELTVKQENFCQEYIFCGNKTEAFKIAYDTSTMKESTLGWRAHTLSVEPKISTRIAELKAEIQERNKITIDELVQDLAKMVRFDPADMYDELGDLKNIHNMPKPVRQMMAGIDITSLFEKEGKKKIHVGYLKKIKLIDKLGAIEKLMKHLGGYEKDNKQKKSEVVVFEIPDNKR